MTAQTPPSEKSHSALTKQGLVDRRATLDEAAGERLERIRNDKKELARNRFGQFAAKVTLDQWDEMLELVAAGYADKDICLSYGLNKSAISVKRREEPRFNDAYLAATAELWERLAKEAQLVAEGVDGYSSKDVQRDRLIVKTRLTLAEKLSPKIFGAKADPQTAIQINITRIEDDIC